jgi:acetolactate synthase-1/2/3 large subunit
MTGAQILVECLRREGVEIIFGYPGGVLIPVFDVLHDTKDIRVILTRHEQGAAHAAEGYARASGKVGVCLATSGPGATNTVTGIANAYMDSIPVVFLTGQVSTNLIGNDAFQEADIVGITRSITKHNYLVKDVRDLARIIREAFLIAGTGRPGPVLVDLPKDVSTAQAEFVWPESVKVRGYNPTLDGNPRQIKRAAEMINEASRPLLYVGGGAISAGAGATLGELANKARIPVTMTLLGLGAFSGTDPLSLGMLGMHGTVYANNAVQECDLLIAVGARFDDRVTGKIDEFAPHAKVIHIDIDPTSVSKNVQVDVPIVGDVDRVLKELLPLIEKPDTAAWLATIAGWKKESPLAWKEEAGVIKPQSVIRRLSELTKGDAIVCTEVGQHQMWAAQYFDFTTPRSFVSSGGLGTMGFGFPAAIGAQFAFPERLVLDIAGDGSIQMNIQELATAVINRLPVKIIVLNNGYLGMVRQWQDLFFDKRYSSVCLDRKAGCPPQCSSPGGQCPEYIPDFVKLAEAYGAYGRRVDDPAELDEALKDILSRNETCLLDVRVAREENVYPMVPAGAGLSQMIGGLA